MAVRASKLTSLGADTLSAEMAAGGRFQFGGGLCRSGQWRPLDAYRPGGVALALHLAYHVISQNGRGTVMETPHLFSRSQISNGVNLVPAVVIKENRREGKTAIADHIRENSLVVAIHHFLCNMLLQSFPNHLPGYRGKAINVDGLVLIIVMLMSTAVKCFNLPAAIDRHRGAVHPGLQSSHCDSIGTQHVCQHCRVENQIALNQ